MKTGWDYIFLDFDTTITYENRIAIADNVIEMFEKEEKERHIDTGSCEANIKTKNEHMICGSFYGKVYYATIESNNGVLKLKLLVCKLPDNTALN